MEFMRPHILMAAVATAMLLSCGPSVPAHVTPDPALLTLVPADTVMLVGARLDHLRETDFYRKHIASAAPAPLERFIDQTGIDPHADIREVLAAYNGKDMLLMSRGKFSPSGLKPHLKQEGAKRTPYKGYTLIGDKSRAVVFMNPTTAVAARPERLRALIDSRGASGGPPPALMKMMNTIDRSNQVWLVALGGRNQAVRPRAGYLAPFAGILQRVTRLTAELKFNRSIVLNASGECTSATDAESLQSALRVMIGLVRLGAHHRPAIGSLMDAFAVSHQDRVVEIHASVSPELADRLFPAAADASR